MLGETYDCELFERLVGSVEVVEYECCSDVSLSTPVGVESVIGWTTRDLEGGVDELVGKEYS